MKKIILAAVLSLAVVPSVNAEDAQWNNTTRGGKLEYDFSDLGEKYVYFYPTKNVCISANGEMEYTTINVNGQAVVHEVYCRESKNHYDQLVAKSEAGSAFIINEMLTKSKITIDGVTFKTEGFAAAYNDISIAL